MDVTLSWREVRLAALAGIDRQIYALSQGLRHRQGIPDERGWDIHIIGALGEWATAKALGRYWSDHLPGPGDIAGLEVRATTRTDGSLIVQTIDSDEAPFILVAGNPPTLHIVGWLTGADAKRDEWLHAPNGRPAAYFVPQSALRPLDEL